MDTVFLLLFLTVDDQPIYANSKDTKKQNPNNTLKSVVFSQNQRPDRRYGKPRYKP